MQLAGPPFALGVGGGDSAPQSIGFDAAIQSHGVGRRGRERPQQLLVLLAERVPLRATIERGQDPETGAAVEDRNEQGGLGVVHAEAPRAQP